jgi:hypothetical protein
MNIEFFKSDVATQVAAKVGITARQASIILDHLFGLRETAAEEKRINVKQLGEVCVINRKAVQRPGLGDLKIEESAFETVAQFKVGQIPKEVTILGLDDPLHKSTERVSVIEHGNSVILVSRLEGDPAIPRKRRKGLTA